MYRVGDRVRAVKESSEKGVYFSKGDTGKVQQVYSNDLYVAWDHQPHSTSLEGSWFIPLKDVERIYRLGDRFSLKDSKEGGEFMLVQVEPGLVKLINLTTGNRVTDLVIAPKHSRSITQKEFDIISGLYKYELIH